MKYAKRLFGRPEYAKHMSKGASVLKSANVLLFMGMTFDHNETPNSTFNSAASYSTTALAVPLLSVVATTSGILQVLQYRKEMKKERERFDSKDKLLKSLDIMLNKGGADNPVYEDYRRAIYFLKYCANDEKSGLSLEEIYKAAALLEEFYDQELVHGGRPIFKFPDIPEVFSNKNLSEEQIKEIDNSFKVEMEKVKNNILAHLKQRGVREKYEETLKLIYTLKYNRYTPNRLDSAASKSDQAKPGEPKVEVVETSTPKINEADSNEPKVDGGKSNEPKFNEEGFKKPFKDEAKSHVRKASQQYVMKADRNIGKWGPRVVVGWGTAGVVLNTAALMYRLGALPAYTWLGYLALGVEVLEILYFMSLAWPRAKKFVKTLTRTTEEEQNELAHRIVCEILLPLAEQLAAAQEAAKQAEVQVAAKQAEVQVAAKQAEVQAAADKAVIDNDIANQVEVSNEDKAELEKAQQRAARLQKAQAEAEIRRVHLYKFLGLKGQRIERMIELKDGAVVTYEELRDLVIKSMQPKDKQNEPIQPSPAPSQEESAEQGVTPSQEGSVEQPLEILEMWKKVERAERVVKHDEIIAKNLSERSSTNMDSFRKNGLFAAYFILAITSAIDFVQKLHGSGFNALGAKSFKKAQFLVGTTYLSPFIFGMVTLHAITQLMNYRHLRATEAAKYENAETVKAAFLPGVDITLTGVQIEKITGAIESNKIDAKTAYMALAAIRKLEEHLPTLRGRDAFDLSSPEGVTKAKSYLKGKRSYVKNLHVLKLLDDLANDKDIDPKTIEAAAATYTLEADRKYNRLALVTAVFIMAQAGSKTIIDTAALLNKLHIININSALLANLSAIAGFSAILGVILFVLKSYPDIKDFVDGLSFGKDTEEQKKEKLAATIVADIWIAGSALTAEEKKELKEKLTEDWQIELVDLIDQQGDYKNYELMINAATEHLKKAQDIEDVNLDNLVKGVKKAVMDELGVHASLSCRKSTLDSFVNDRAHIQNPVVNEGVQH
jgi:hypothetical protein